MSPSIPVNEAARLRRLRDLRLLDTAPEGILDGFTQLAADCTGCPIALISLIEADRQWFKSSVGLPAAPAFPTDWPRSTSFCAHAICRPGAVFEVEDARCDPRFMHNPAVRGSPGLAHYAGAPLVMPDGEAIGTLCVADPQPGRLSEPQRKLLLELSRQIVRVLLLREQTKSLEREKLLQQAVDVDLADLAPCGVYAMDPNGLVLHANEHWARMLGAPNANEVLGDAWMAYVHPEDLDHVLQTRRAGLVNEHGYAYLFRTCPDSGGTTRWVRSRVRAVDSRLAPIAFVGAAVDVTQIREAEEELRRHNRLLETIIQSLPCGVAVLDAELHPVLSNQTARDVIEDPEAALEVSTLEFLPIARQIAAASEVRGVQARAADIPPRKAALALVHAAPLPGGWTVATFTDVTVARKAADDLRISEERLASALEASGLLLWDLDVCSQTLCLPGATAALFGMPARDTQLPVQEFIDSVAPEFQSQLRGVFRDLCLGRTERSRIQYQVCRRDGTSIWVLAYGKVSDRAPDGTALKVAGTCKDVTQAVQADEKLQAAVAAADQANQAKSKFLATMSHEIRTPLNGVIGLAQLLSDAELPPLERKSVEMLRGCAKTLLGIVDNILDFSKIEAGHLSLEEIPADLDRIVQEMDNVSRVRAADKGIAFELEVSRDVPIWITADPTRLRQILLNLLGNALKFTERGSVRLRVGVTTTLAGARLRFAVSDTGIGISQMAQRQLFTRFAQVDPSTTRRFGGTGLGLAISRQLAQLMGGDIAVESREGEGATFTLDIPLRLAAPPTQARVSSAGAVRPNAKILVAEDNVVNQHVLYPMLAMLGYQDVMMVGDGDQAVRACREESFDLILMDCQMPLLDGRDATRQLRLAGQRVPVIALTATATDRDRNDCLDAGMNDYLTKPIELPVLGEKVQRWLSTPPTLQATSAPAAAAHQAFFNTAAIGRYFLGDMAFFNQSRDLFVRTSRDSHGQLRAAIAAGNEEVARRLCHQIKATAGTLGAEKLALLCQRYEAGEVSATSAASWLAEVLCAFDAFVKESEGITSAAGTKRGLHDAGAIGAALKVQSE